MLCETMLSSCFVYYASAKHFIFTTKVSFFFFEKVLFDKIKTKIKKTKELLIKSMQVKYILMLYLHQLVIYYVC